MPSIIKDTFYSDYFNFRTTTENLNQTLEKAKFLNESLNTIS